MIVDLTNLSASGIPNLGAIRQMVQQHGSGRLRIRTVAAGEITFRIGQFQNGCYDAFIETAINFRGRPTGNHATHRLDLNTASPRICFSQERPPRDLPTAIALTMCWAQCTDRYIRTGVWA